MQLEHDACKLQESYCTLSVLKHLMQAFSVSWMLSSAGPNCIACSYSWNIIPSTTLPWGTEDPGGNMEFYAALRYLTSCFGRGFQPGSSVICAGQ